MKHNENKQTVEQGYMGHILDLTYNRLNPYKPTVTYMLHFSNDLCLMLLFTHISQKTSVLYRNTKQNIVK